MWLYNLVFSPAIEAAAELAKLEAGQKSNLDNAPIHRWGDSEESAANSSASQALVPRSHSSLARLQALTQEPPEASTVINELLSEWTTLTEVEIEGVDIRAKRGEKIPSPSPASDTADDSMEMIYFKDAVGRQFELPFQLTRDWTGMKDLINHMFRHVDVIGPQVQAGYYDLLNSRGKICLPVVWKYCNKPNESYTMEMWPMIAKQRPEAGRLPDKGSRVILPHTKSSFVSDQAGPFQPRPTHPVVDNGQSRPKSAGSKFRARDLPS